MATKQETKKEDKKVADGFFKDNTVEIDINGRKVRVFEGEAELIKSKLSKKTKK